MNKLKKYIYYRFKPIIPRFIQIYVRRSLVRRKMELCEEIWPIDERAGDPPEGWGGWPDGKQFALVLTHDVDTGRGLERTLRLAELEKKLGFKSSFNFVPEKYNTPESLRKRLEEMGFEVGVHGLNHDGKLFSSWKIFQERAGKINRYISDWGAVGFRSPAMHHNLEWIGELCIEYDSSTFDTDPFEPQPDGVSTIFPFYVERSRPGKGYVELPYTLPQDFTLFVLMGEKDFRIWRRKLEWISDKGGMALLNTHPDYMSFDGERGREEYPVEIYEEFLVYARERFGGMFWNPLPREVARFWKDHVKKEVFK